MSVIDECGEREWRDPTLACLKPFAQQATDDRTDITPLSDITRPEPEPAPAHELVDDVCVVECDELLVDWRG